MKQILQFQQFLDLKSKDVFGFKKIQNNRKSYFSEETACPNLYKREPLRFNSLLKTTNEDW